MPWEPIIPARPIVNYGSIEAKALARMKTLTNDLQRECANYEVPPTLALVPYKSRTRSSKTGRLVKRRGKRILGYRRTNMLKKSWSHRVGYGILSRALVGEVRSSGKVAPYNKYVRDPKKQTRVMRNRGWLTTSKIMDKHWPKAQADFRRILAGR